MDLVIFARFHARAGQEQVLASVLREQVKPVRNEPGCIEIGAYASARDHRLYFIHSRWTDGAAFEAHANLPRTLQFIEPVEGLIDHALDVSRAQKIAWRASRPSTFALIFTCDLPHVAQARWR